MKKLLGIVVLGLSLVMLSSCDYFAYKDCKKSLMKDGYAESAAAKHCRK